jgi:ankyrin repeat protein
VSLERHWNTKNDAMNLQPLHLAVEASAIKAVELLLACSHVANAIRDSDGCLPLHIAVRRGFSRIAEFLINAYPSTLCVEDGVGSAKE